MIYRFNDSAHYLFLTSPPPPTSLSSRTELPFPKHQAINKQKTQHPSNTNRAGSAAATHSRRCFFYLQSQPYKERNPRCVPAIHTLAHTDVIIVLFCVCLCLINVIYIYPPFFLSLSFSRCHPRQRFTMRVFSLCVHRDTRCQALTRKIKDLQQG